MNKTSNTQVNNDKLKSPISQAPVDNKPGFYALDDNINLPLDKSNSFNNLNFTKNFEPNTTFTPESKPNNQTIPFDINSLNLQDDNLVPEGEKSNKGVFSALILGLLLSLIGGGLYFYFNINESIRTSSNDKNENFTCPTGYIRVPGNSLYQTKDFCVMKYEAKTGSSTVAVTTVAKGNPIKGINQTDSISACNANNIGGATGYGLINNREWMTIARNIEAQGINWTGGSVGNGGLNRGHSKYNPDGTLAASTDDRNGCFGYTNGISCPNGSWHLSKRTHTLSNGEVIWDLSGNVWEWTDDTILEKDQPTGSSTDFTWRGKEYNAGLSNSITSFGLLGRDLTGPSNSNWGSAQNMGKIYSDRATNSNASFAFRRGGDWRDQAGSGVFALSFLPDYGRVGFRCVLR